MSLSTILQNRLSTDMGDDSGPWRQFILDHLDYIALRSTSYSLEPELMYKYQYDLDSFLSDYLKRHVNLGWIVKLVNSLKSDLDFVEIATLIVPGDDLITKMYHSYLTIKTNAK